MKQKGTLCNNSVPQNLPIDFPKRLYRKRVANDGRNYERRNKKVHNKFFDNWSDSDLLNSLETAISFKTEKDIKKIMQELKKRNIKVAQ